MRTKALLLAAAFAAAGLTSQAAVFSVNAVGYVNLTLPTGFSLVSNPLDAGTGNNTVAKLFGNIQGGVPNNTQVFLYNADGTYTTVQYVTALGGWNPPAAAAREIATGTGAFFNNRSGAPLTLTFVGEVEQGDIVNQVPVGFSIQANPVPQAGAPNSFPTSSFPGANGDRIYRFDKTTKEYRTHIFNVALGGWTPALPSVEVGEAFFYFRSANNGATTWTRTFNVNNS